MNVLLIGSGVIGSIYGTQLGGAGHKVTVLLRPGTNAMPSSARLDVRDAANGTRRQVQVETVSDPASREYDLVLVAVRRDQLASTFSSLSSLRGAPHIIFFGNNPDGRNAISVQLPGTFELGFPGVGGVLSSRDGTVEYLRIAAQHTMLEADRPSPRSAQFENALRTQHFPVHRSHDMEVWLAFHAVFVASIAAALLNAEVDPVRLANDHGTLTLMCRAIEEGFRALRVQGTHGLPTNLAILHRPILRPIAVRYWARTMRTAMGELCFAGHTRHAADEMIALGTWVLAATADTKTPNRYLNDLLTRSA
jgi:ketopantoate reductase